VLTSIRGLPLSARDNAASSCTAVPRVSLARFPCSMSFSFFGTLFGQLANFRNFTRAFPLERLPPADVVHGGHIVITGGSSGMGRELALVICERRAFRGITLVGRSVSRLESVVQRCQDLYPEVDIKYHVCDLADIHQVHEFCDGISKQDVDVLVNNAGALCHERQLSVDGVEQTFATHVVAPWILTNRLKPAKTIHNLSGGMLTQKLSLDQIEAQFESATFDGTQVYAQCKRALFEATQWLHQSGSYQQAVSSHPGWVDTPGVASLFEAHPEYKMISFRPVRDGCLGLFVLATTPLSELQPGGFYYDGVQTHAHCWLAGTQSTDQERDQLCAFLNRVSGLDVQ